MKLEPQRDQSKLISQLKAITMEGDSARNSFVRSFHDRQQRQEAWLLLHWILAKNFETFIPVQPDPIVDRGENPPDFLLRGDVVIAVEATTFVTERKAIYDKTGPHVGLYTSTLRATKADAAFHQQIKTGSLADNSRVRPHAEAFANLDNDYYITMEPVLSRKISAAQQYCRLYHRTIILVEDSLSELESALQRRLPRLQNFIRSLNPPETVEVVVMNTGFGPAGVAHWLWPNMGEGNGVVS